MGVSHHVSHRNKVTATQVRVLRWFELVLTGSVLGKREVYHTRKTYVPQNSLLYANSCKSMQDL